MISLSLQTLIGSIVFSFSNCCLQIPPPPTITPTTPTTPKTMLDTIGCQFSNSAPMFYQHEDQSDPITKWDFRIRYTRTVENKIKWKTYAYMPDGHISTLQVETNLSVNMCRLLYSFLNTIQNVRLN